jgi:hypothetical protein
MVKYPMNFALRASAALAVAFFLFSALGLSQEKASAVSTDQTTISALRDLQEQVRQLRLTVEEMRSENAQSRAEMQQLRRELRAPGQKPEATGEAYGLSASSADLPASAADRPPDGSVAASRPANLLIEERVENLEESTQLLGSKIDEQYQTKVESASKYHARLSGIVLMNLFRNHGASDNLDFPNFAQPNTPGAQTSSFGATLRQSEIGLEVFGPTVAGAKTWAAVQLDFAGGFPSTENGVNSGLVRLQTASLHLDWEHTSVIAGQDSLFLSPLAPTSFASLAIPAFAYAGNLWAWTPQLRVEHRFELAGQQTILVQGGIFDNLNWEPNFNQFQRTPQSGEQSGQPAYGLRTAWSHLLFDRPLTVGVAGYYGRQSWSWDRYVDGWGGMTDWQIPLAPRLTLSGEFYRGRGLGGLGAGIGRAVLYNGPPTDASTTIRGLDSAGGWTQLKLRLTSKLEFNGVFAEDDAFAGDVRGFATDQENFGTILGRNRGISANLVYRPRSDLLLSTEFIRLRSFPIYSGSNVTNQLNLAMGILF